MSKIARYLNQLTVGNVFDTPEVLEAYSTDRSALKIKPKLVAFPESTADVRKLLSFCYQLTTKGIKLPVAVRGSGLDEMGADLTNGLVISTEKLNCLLESDRRERLVRVQAGITLKELNTALSVNGLTIPIGGHDTETIGGLISNCPRDNYSGKYGGIMNYVDRIEIVLANGDILQTGRMSLRSLERQVQSQTSERNVYSKIAKIIQDNAETIEKIKTAPSNLAGYTNVARTVHGGSIDLLPLFFGAEGTLGVISEVILRAVPISQQTGRIVATFEDIVAAQKFLDFANTLKPRELNIYNINVIKVAEETGKRLSSITKKMERGYVVFARFDNGFRSKLRKIAGLKKTLPKSSQLIIESSKTKTELDEFCNSLVSFLNYAKSGERLPLLTDFYLPNTGLQDFMEDLTTLEKNLKLELSMFGSYSASNYSVRPKFNLGKEDFGREAIALIRAGSYIINRRGGTVAGGSPEGRIKALATNGDFSDEEKALHLAVKQAFDPQGVLNPDIKLGVDSHYTISHFRTSNSARVMI